MNIKTLIQFFIFFLIVLFVYIFVDNTFLTEQKNIVEIDRDKNEIIEEIEIKKNDTNIIENLNYISIDALGNEYILNAKFGKRSSEDPNVIILNQVEGIIKLKNKSDIEIKSDFAKYNSESFDTNFYQNVVGFFEDSKIDSDNLDFFFNDNKGIMYNNIKYQDRDTVANADQISFNLLNGDVDIKMFDKNKMIRIIKN
tara:strand:+ start:335 stop:928 length:594 start_codon:yes stop_codon:yes gene_type:complete